MKQYQKVAHLLGNLVRDYSQCRHQPELGSGEKRGCDQHTVDEVMERIPDHDHQTAAPMIVFWLSGVSRMAVMAVMAVMTVRFQIVGPAVTVMMAPQHELLEYEEHEQPAQHRCAQHAGA